MSPHRQLTDTTVNGNDGKMYPPPMVTLMFGSYSLFLFLQRRRAELMENSSIFSPSHHRNFSQVNFKIFSLLINKTLLYSDFRYLIGKEIKQWVCFLLVFSGIINTFFEWNRLNSKKFRSLSIRPLQFTYVLIQLFSNHQGFFYIKENNKVYCLLQTDGEKQIHIQDSECMFLLQ